MQRLSLAPIVLLLPGVVSAAPNPGGLFISHFDHILGTSLNIKLMAPTPAVARKAQQVILEEIDRLDVILSSYQPNSEFSRWVAAPLNTAVTISEELFATLIQFQYWQEITNGAINAASEHLVRLWNLGTHYTPSFLDKQEAVTLVNQKHWELDPNNQTATRLTDINIRLNTFTKSYIMDRAAALALEIPGLNGLVLNCGGDIVVRGNWQETVTVANPQDDAQNAAPIAQIHVQNAAVATSGAYRRGIKTGSEWKSHIMDPRTALPAHDIISATVLHPDPVKAGALATAFNILSAEERTALTAQLPGTEYFLITRDGKSITSAGWPGTATASFQPMPTVANLLSVPVKEKLWNPKQELLITLELGKFEGRYHRPFVAVWIEDEAGKPVRQLALWYNKPKWLRDLRQWNSLRTEDAASVTSATRSPGKYTLVWDGKDDKGKLVPQGKYTVMIEAAREHGSYQLIRETMDFKGKLKKQTLKGNVEITAAALDYREKPTIR